MKIKDFLETGGMEKLNSFDYVKDKLFVKMVNEGTISEEFLAKIPHKKINDMIASVHIMIPSDGNDLYSTPLTISLLEEKYGRTFDEIFDMSVKNMSYNIEDIKGVLQMMSPNAADLDFSFDEDKVADRMYVISNDTKRYGAAAVFDKDFMDEVKDKIGSDFYLLPSSVNEWIITLKPSGSGRDIIEIEALEAIINEINGMLPNNEILSNKLYEYDYNTHEIVLSADREYDDYDNDLDEGIDK